MQEQSKPVAVITIASANYVPYVETLMQSVKNSNPDYRRYFVIVDKCERDEIENEDLFEIIEAEELGIDVFDDMTIRYDVMELNTAIKPFAIEWLFENTDAKTVIYLDPDIRVYRPLHELEATLNRGASVVVTPHITAPLEDGRTPDDHSMLQAGVFNLGFIAVRDVPESRAFIAWWGRRLKDACHADFARNLFTDQRWIDLAPCFLADLSVLRSPAYNVAYWNLMQRPITSSGKKVRFGGEDLAFFHFSGLQADKPTVVSKHQDRLSWEDIKPLHRLFKDYREELTANGWRSQRSRPYHYDRADELKISPVVRQLYRDLYPSSRKDVRRSRSFLLAMCNQPAGPDVDPSNRLTRLMYKVYRDRPDLQAAFPLQSPEGVSGMVAWFEASAEREYGLDPRFVHPSRGETTLELQGSLPPFAIPPGPNHGKPWHYRQWRKTRKWLIERI